MNEIIIIIIIIIIYNNNYYNYNNNNIQVLGAFNEVSMLLQAIINKYKKRNIIIIQYRLVKTTKKLDIKMKKNMAKKDRFLVGT